MTSEIKVDTISEQTSANGVAIDGLTIKDGGISATTGAIVFNEASADLDFRIESNANANRFKIDGGDDVVVMGTGTVEDSIYGAKPALQLTGTDFNSSAFSIIRNAADANSPNLIFGKSRSADGNTVVQDGDDLGNITFAAADGTDQNNTAARIYAEVDGTPGANDTPGRLVLATTADGANSATERVRITSSGKVGIAETNPQAKLSIGGHMSITATSRLYFDGAGDTFISEASANVMAFTTGNSERMRISSDGLHIGGTGSANALDDYEEGTWTAVIKDGSGNAVTMADAAASYTKVGRLVFISGYLRVNGLGSASGGVSITGLPFAIPNANNAYASVSIGYAANLDTSAVSPLAGYTGKNTSVLVLQNWDAAHSTSNLQASELSANGEFIFSCSYYTT